MAQIEGGKMEGRVMIVIEADGLRISLDGDTAKALEVYGMYREAIADCMQAIRRARIEKTSQNKEKQ